MSAAAPFFEDGPASPPVASYRSSPASTFGEAQQAAQEAETLQQTTADHTGVPAANRVETCQVAGCLHELRDDDGEPRYYKVGSRRRRVR